MPCRRLRRVFVEVSDRPGRQKRSQSMETIRDDQYTPSCPVPALVRAPCPKYLRALQRKPHGGLLREPLSLQG